MMRFINRLLHGSREKFERDLQAWGLTGRQALVIAATPIIIVLAMTAMVPFSELFVWVTAEDSLMEWLQFLLLLATSLTFTRLGIGLIRSRGRGVGMLCLIVALGTFFVAGEEIAWGQRIFGWATPETLEAVNYQNETTLHNIGSAHQAFIYAVMLGGMYGALVPLFCWALWNERPRSLLSYLLVPPLCLVPAFFLPFGYRFSRLVSPIDARYPHLIFYITKFSEVTELCLYFGLVVFAWLNLRRLHQEYPSPLAQYHSGESSARSSAQ